MTTRYYGPIGDPTSSFRTGVNVSTTPIGGDPPVTFNRGTVAFTSGNAVPSFIGPVAAVTTAPDASEGSTAPIAGTRTPFVSPASG